MMLEYRTAVEIATSGKVGVWLCDIEVCATIETKGDVWEIEDIEIYTYRNGQRVYRSLDHDPMFTEDKLAQLMRQYIADDLRTTHKQAIEDYIAARSEKPPLWQPALEET